MNRKQRRAATSADKQDEISDKVAMFQNLPDECLACLKPFDKKNKEMALTWNVVVRDKDTVRLYCPECWNRAQTAVEEFKQEIEK
tara:strand:+ start:40 stop:294 length:255 start_codon:yes stop_codon:yes gene_type:complete